MIDRPNVKESDREDVKHERKWLCGSGSVCTEGESDESRDVASDGVKHGWRRDCNRGDVQGAWPLYQVAVNE